MATAPLASACIVLILNGAGAFVPSLHGTLTQSSRQTVRIASEVHSISRRPMSVSMSVDVSKSRIGFLEDSATVSMAAGALVLGTSTGLASPAEAAQVSAWEQISLPVASVLYDIAFDPVVPDHGLVVGAQGTFLEVKSVLQDCRLAAAVVVASHVIFAMYSFSGLLFWALKHEYRSWLIDMYATKYLIAGCSCFYILWPLVPIQSPIPNFIHTQPSVLQ